MQEDKPRGRQRRASFNSMYDAGDEVTQRSSRRAVSRSSLSQIERRVPSAPDARPSTRATTRATERTQSNIRQGEPVADQPRRGRLTAYEFANNLQHYRRRKRSSSSQKNVQVWRRSGSRDSYGSRRRRPLIEQNIGNIQPAESSFEETLLSLPEVESPPNHVVPPEALYRPSGTQMIGDAETFDYHRLRNIIRKVMRRWSKVTLQRHNHHQKLEAMASRLDSEALLRQGFDHWRSMYHGKRQAAETDRFFAHLERRAGKARDLYLLTKAFTHWAQTASDEVFRTSVARRHILRTKYFNAWREITAVNELKVRRQGLKKFFTVWKRCYNIVVADNITAVTVYQEDLVRFVYWQWFWSFCDRRAPQWRSGKMKKKYLAHWIAAVQRNRQRRGWVESHHRDNVQRNILGAWLERTRTILSCEREAVFFRRRRLLASLLPQWQARLRLVPIARNVSNIVDWRIARSAFSTWVLRLRMIGQATQVNQLRLLRNAWTKWNDHLRWQTLAQKIDDRVVLQALYKWVLAERCILLRRLFTQRLKDRVLSRVVRHWRILEANLYEKENTTHASRDRRLLTSVFDRWRHQMELLRQKQQLVFEFNAPKLVQESLRAWTVRLHYLQQLHRRAEDAQFYILATKSLRRWHQATNESKRQKRRDAYAQVRRRTKTNLARSIFVPWRERTHAITEMQRRAGYTYQSRLFMIGTDLFDIWRRRLDSVHDMNYHAESINKAVILQRCLQSWSTLSQRTRIQHEQARTYYIEMHVSSVASGLLRKLSLRVFEIRSRQETAESLAERNRKKHFRNIFRHWQDSVSERRLRRHQAPLQSARSRRGIAMNDDHRHHGEEDVNFDEVFDLGEWTSSIDPHANTTQVPGYLNTPSKRAARAKNIVRMSTTPKTPSTPRGTPFERRLRSWTSTEPRSLVQRSQLGRSAGTWQTRFDDIQEASPGP